MKPFLFERLVEFPEEPFVSGDMYFGLLGYPGEGAGRPGGAGAKFARALGSLRLYHLAKRYGVKPVAERLGNPDWRPPLLRNFEPTVVHGLRHVRRRLTVASLHETRVLQTIKRPLDFANAALTEKMEPWGAAVRPRLDILERRTSVNDTVRSGDDAETIKDRLRDFKDRRIHPSECTLHMAYGLNWSLAEARAAGSLPKEPLPLSVIALRPELWVERAIELAISWRCPSLPAAGRPAPDTMIEIRRRMQPKAPPPNSLVSP